jgi:hypothetical protein
MVVSFTTKNVVLNGHKCNEDFIVENTYILALAIGASTEYTQRDELNIIGYTV